MKRIILYAFFAFMMLPAIAQIIISEPALPMADEEVIIYFDASGTALELYSGTVYAHTGLLKNSGTQWSNVIGTWGDNDTQPALSSLGNHLYSLNLTPSVRDFYDADANDQIEKMAFVFRGADGTQQTEDLFLDVYESGLNVSISSPNQSPYFVDPGQMIPVLANANGADSIMLYVDGILLHSAEGNSIEQNITAGSQADTKSWIKVVAVAGSDQVSDSVYYYVRGETLVLGLPPGVRDGINYINDGMVTLVLLAPYKNSVYVHGDFNNWEIGPEYKLQRSTASASDPDTRYWVTFNGLNPGEEYAFQYIIDEELFVADPYTDKILDPSNDPYIGANTYPNLKEYPFGKTTGIVSVFETAQTDYAWEYDDFIAPKTTDLVVYEMLVRDFTEAHTYAAVTDTLDYLKRLGINALELMPVNEFEGNSSWGYNPSFYFAPDKYYGPKNELKRLIDECHKRGIAVILDIVLNHSYDQSPLVQMYFDGSKPTSDNPWYNVESNFENPDAQWGNDFDHTSEHTRNFVDSVNSYWMSEYRIDGFRFDFTKGFSNTYHSMSDPWGSNYDGARIFILQRMANEIWDRNEDAIIIFEHLSENSEEKKLADHGILLWGNLNYNYSEASMGYHDGNKSNFSGISYQLRDWEEPNLLGYMESHDEERVMFKNLSWGNQSTDYNIMVLDTALARIRLNSVFFYTVPGPKMIWQFGELGYDYSIDYNGRLGEKPVRWDYYDDWRRNYNYRFTAELIKLRIENDAFETNDFSLNVGGAMKSMRLNSSSMNVLVLGNFDIEQGDIEGDFAHTGDWYEYFTGSTLEVSDVNMMIPLEAGEYRLYTDVQMETPDIGTVIGDVLDKEHSSIMLFPNPVNQDAQLQIDLQASTELKIRVFNLLGIEVMHIEDQVYAEGKHMIALDLGTLLAGVYFCNVSSLHFTDTIKFIKQ